LRITSVNLLKLHALSPNSNRPSTMSAFVYVTLLAGLVAVSQVAGQSSGACSSTSVPNSGSAIIGSSVSPVFGAAGGSQVSGFCSCQGKKDADYLRLFFSAQASPTQANPAFSVTCAKPKKLCICPPSGKCYKAKKATGATFYSSCVGGSCALYAAPVCSEAGSKKAGFKAKKKFTCADAVAAASVSGLPIAAAVSCAGCGAAKKMIKASSACTLQYAYFPTTIGNASGNVTRPGGNGTGPTLPPLNITGSPPPPPNGTTIAGVTGGSTLSGASAASGGSTVSGASAGSTVAGGSTASGGSTVTGASTAGATTAAPTTTETTTVPAPGR
jgi:hypothetical protein